MGGRVLPPTGDLLKKVKRILHDGGVYGTLTVDEGGAPAPKAPQEGGNAEAVASTPSVMVMFKDSETGQKIRVGWEADLKAVANKIIKSRKG